MKVMDVLEESFNDEIIGIVIDGFHLEPTKHGFGKAYTTKNNKPSIGLKNAINKWIEKKFPNSGVKIDLEKTTKTFNFFITKKD